MTNTGVFSGLLIPSYMKNICPKYVNNLLKELYMQICSAFGVPVVADVPGVGQNLHNHVSVSIPILLNKRKRYNRLNITTLGQYLFNRDGPMSSTGMSQLTGFVLVNKSSTEWNDYPDMQFFFEGMNANCSSTGFSTLETDRRLMIKMIPTLLRPLSKGFIELKSANPLVYPKIVSNYLTKWEDAELLVMAIRYIQKFLLTATMRAEDAEIQFSLINELAAPCTALTADSDDYWRCVVRHLTNPENHQMATCRMGTDTDSMAVLNPKLQVREVTNLRVVDASVFPSVVSGNINAPIIMAAEKGSDIIKEHWLGSPDVELSAPSSSEMFMNLFNKPFKAPSIPLLSDVPPDYYYLT